MRMRRMLLILLSGFLLAGWLNPCVAVEAEEKAGAGLDLKIQAKAAVLLDADTGTVLYEQNAHESLPPASVTKVMTILLTMEAIEDGRAHLNDTVTISHRAASMGGSQMFMEEGEQQTLENLLRGVSICSANDACVACAEFIGGTEEEFVAQMNQRAKELGMKDTHFVNTNGLPVADHYSSAYDIGVMSKELMRFQEPKEWFGTWQTTITVGKKEGKKTDLGLTNTNRLIKLYPGANGIKTGFTQDAGYCLSGSATKGNTTLIAVVLGCETTKIRWSETMRLLDYGFANWESVAVAGEQETFGMVPVEKGIAEGVPAVSGKCQTILVPKGKQGSLQTEASLKKSVSAPVKKGDTLGNMVVYCGKEKMNSFPLVAGCDVPKAGFSVLYIRMMKEIL